MEDYKKLNEEVEKFLEADGYKLTIITGRDRDSDGRITKDVITAKNDVDAFCKVLTEYGTCCSGYFNGEYELEELDDEEKEMIEKINVARETGENQEEAIELISNLYNDTMDISDYYDDIVTLNRPDGTILFEDDIDLESWFGGDDDDYDEEEE